MKRRGSVLLLALWATVILALLGIGQATRLSLETRWVSRIQEGGQAWYLAWAGVQLASHQLLADSDAAWDAPKERWGQPLPDPIPLDSGRLKYQVTDEQSRIPLNSAPGSLLLNLPGFNPEAADELLSWRAAQKIIVDLQQLTALKGFDPEAIPALIPLVTVYGAGPVNFNTASAEVLMKLGFSAPFAGQVAQYRPSVDGIWGTPDDQIFYDQEGIYNAFGPLPSSDQTLLNNLLSSQQLGFRSSFFQVTVDGETARHGIQKRVVATMERTGSPAQAVIRGWHET